MNLTSGPRRLTSAAVGLALLAGLWLASFVLGRFDGAAGQCPFGADPLRPDQTVCELAFGGLWVSMSIGLAAGALATLVGLVVAFAARTAGGFIDRWLMRLADVTFSLPDVLLLMVIQTAGQTLGEIRPELRLPPAALLVASLTIVSWAAPARMFRNRLVTLEGQEFVAAAKALGGTRAHLLRAHLWRGLRGFALTVFLARIPAAILAESTVSFFGIARVEPMSLGRYLGTSYSAILYEGGARVVLPAWSLLILVVLGATLAARGFDAPRAAAR